MKWLKLVKNPPVKIEGHHPPGQFAISDIPLDKNALLGLISDTACIDVIDSGPPPLPEPKDIPVKLALEALTAQGIMIKNLTQNTSYSYEAIEFDLSMTILIESKTGKEVLSSLNDWFFSKVKGW
ncbi:MAG: hypothetical protein KJZ83_00205 [Burkholderiaceae bacterium]|nr:hypothetical protein [Burkholderiaceae bacterium]